MNSLFLVDGYKIGHHLMYPKGIQKIFSNFTPRSNKYAPFGNNSKVLNFGQQAVVKYIKEHFDLNFFNKPKEEVILDLKKELEMYLGTVYDTSHFEYLHDLGYLPLEIRSLEEGTESDIKVPILTIVNTDEKCYWLTNYLETVISNLLWQPITSATTALIYRRISEKYVKATDIENINMVDWMLHDFSYRGLTGTDAAIFSGMAHASVFLGSDSLPVIKGVRKYYNEKDFVIGSVAASEHSQMTAEGREGEFKVYERLINDFPEGVLSLVSDSYNLWNVLTNYLPKLKELIMSRNGKLVIRPDSGNPVDIICGNAIANDAKQQAEYYSFNGTEDELMPEEKGVIELLWDVFGGTVNKQGYKVLDPHIGMIYGEAINPEMAEKIYNRLKIKGFAATNIFFGIGSASYQWKSRDTWGIACKCTAQLVNNNWNEIYKDPVTDDGTKKSAKGLLKVIKGKLKDQCTLEEINQEDNDLKIIFKDGFYFNETNLTKIRKNVKK